MFTLSPQARAIAVVVLGFLFVNGSLNRLGTEIVAVFVTDVGTRTFTQAVLAVMIVVGIGILLFANATSGKTDGWAQATAQAAQLLAAVGIGITVISLFAVLMHNSPLSYVPLYAG